MLPQGFTAGIIKKYFLPAENNCRLSFGSRVCTAILFAAYQTPPTTCRLCRLLPCCCVLFCMLLLPAPCWWHTCHLLSLPLVPSFKFFPLLQGCFNWFFPDWSSPFALICFHKTSALLQTCPPLIYTHRLLLTLQFVLLVSFHPLPFHTPSILSPVAFTYSFCLALSGSPVPLFSLCKRLAFSIPYTIQPVSVYIRCTHNNRRRNVAFDVNLQVFDTSSKVHFRSTHLHVPNR